MHMFYRNTKPNEDNKGTSKKIHWIGWQIENINCGKRCRVDHHINYLFMYNGSAQGLWIAWQLQITFPPFVSTGPLTALAEEHFWGHLEM
ncbi:hypothetical protein AMECASPLE_023501 [Ameca splendens]|uniref:Uncharacterized protein n=1 Tax=Ameca splendens TaxID=208324 RepID=A0ABV1ACK7_9TELE